MKYLKLMIVMLFLGVVACEGTVELGEDVEMSAVSAGSPVGGGGKADTLAPADGELSGAALYAQHCGSCHGADATGGASYPRSIVGYTPIEQIVLEGDGVMPAIPMSLEEVAAIQAFLLGDEGGEGAATEVEIDGSTPALQVYASQCAGCHGDEGQGGPNGPGIRLRDPNLTRFTVRDGRNGRGVPSVMPTYDHGTITDAQLDEMIEWLDAFPNPTTGEGLYNRYCSNCHGMDGGGGQSFAPVAGRLNAEGIIRSGHGLGRYAERTEYMPAYSQEQLSNDEIDLIERYIREL